VPATIRLTDKGLYCAAGDFYIDPWTRCAHALITHAHADHARAVADHFTATAESVPVLHKRLGAKRDIRGVEYGERLRIGEATVSFHPAGHVLGSAQIRVETGGEVWVASGDYKRDPDPTCRPFETVPCDTFITEATFGLPAYRWRPGAAVAADILRWWNANRDTGKASVLFCYALGKAQRVLAELAGLTDRTAYLHGAVAPLVELYRDAGVAMLPTQRVGEQACGASFAGELVLAPPSAAGSRWMRRFGRHATGFASGWMLIRGNRRRRGYDRGFVLSDHADWPGLIRTVEETGARRVLATHGRADVLVRFLRERGIDAAPLATPFAGEADA
jgi:putative mRNA 3-end processing factor